MIPVLDAYKNDERARPSQSIDPAKKDDTYHMNNAKYIYSLFCRGKCAFGIKSYTAFDTWRSYSLGRQDVSKYKTWLTTDTTTTDSTVALDSFDSTPLSRVAKKEGWYNMIFDNISPAATICDSLHGQFDKQDSDLCVDVIDPESKDIEENEAYLKLFEGLNLGWQNEYKIKAGIPIDEQTYYPKSVQEFEMMKAQGGFKLAVARSMQKILRYTFDLNPSPWDTVTRKKVIDDLICTGYGAVRDYFDSEDNKFKQKWIDPARLVIQFSNEHDYNDADFAGYFPKEGVTISELKRIFPGVDEDVWKNLGKSAMNTYGNPSSDWGTRYSMIDPSTKAYGYDGFKVPVFEAEWTDIDVKKRKYYNDRYGRSQVKDLEFTDKDKAGVKKLSVKHKRKCTWVVGTDYCYDWGVVKMASRKNYSKPQSTFHVEQLLQPSIMERLVPILDQIEITFLRYQNSLAKMVENGYAINTSMLGNASLGGKKLDPRQIIKLFKESGFFLYQYGAGTGQYTGGAALPITAIEGGMKKRVEETMQTLQMWMNTIKTMTGIDVIALANTPVASDTEEIKQEQVQVTLDVAKPILDAAVEIKESCGECLMRRIQTGVKNNEGIRKAYAGVISKADMEALVRMSAEGTQYGLKLKARPDRKARLRFEKWVDIALQNTREQRPGINVNEAMKFGALMDAGVDMNELIQMFDYAVIKNGEQTQANSEKMIKLQGETNAQNEQVKIQGELAKIKAGAEAKIVEEEKRGEIKDRQSNKEMVRDLMAQVNEAANAEEGINTSIRR